MKFIRQTGTAHNDFGADRHIAGFVERAGECIAFCLDEAVKPEDEILTADEYGVRFAAITVPLTLESVLGFVEREVLEEAKLSLDLKAGLKRAEGRLSDLAELPAIVRENAELVGTLQAERDMAAARGAESTTRLERLSTELTELTS